MTEHEWWSCTDSRPMLAQLQLWDRADSRKWRLFAVEACRSAVELMPHADLTAAVESAVRWAEGPDAITHDELVSVQDRIEEMIDRGRERLHHLAVALGIALRSHALSISHCQQVVQAIEAAINVGSIRPGQRRDQQRGQYHRQADVLRDLFGNPFYPMAYRRRWLTTTVVALCETIDLQWAYNRLPILADALEDAGCEEPDVLTHCRGPGPHFRGCWVVDLLLGRG